MRWRLVIGVLLFVINYVLAQDLYSDGCTGSFPTGTTPPNDELMNALYAADPDVDTGRIRFTYTGLDTVNGVFDAGSLSYTNWLARTRNARKDMDNLWFYLARLVTTDPLELSNHYRVAAKLGSNKPRGVIDFDALYDLFDTVCTQYISAHWWLSCFDKNFYCKFKDVFSHQRDVVKKENGIKSITDVVSMSVYGIDDDGRALVLQDLFNQSIIKSIPEQTRKDVFYQSYLVIYSIDNILLDQQYFKFWVKSWSGRSIAPVRAKMIAQCLSYDSSAINREYYCVGKRFMEKIETCSNLYTFELCLFDPLVQEYFAGGTFDNEEKLLLLTRLMSRTQAALSEFNTILTSTSYTGLQALNNKYSPYITMDNSACSLNWMRRFDCQKNWGCVKNVEYVLKLDCNGGSTCKLHTMYRFDCMISFLLKPSQRLVASTSDVIRQEEANVWLAYPPMVQFYPPYTATEISTLVRGVQERAKPLVETYDSNKLQTFIQYLPKVNFVPFNIYKLACIQITVELRYVTYCNLQALFESISMYVDVFLETNSNRIVLNPTVDYVILIGQLQLERVQDFINAQMSFYFNDITSQLQSNFAELSNYFASLAEFDKKITEADIGFISGKLESFNSQITEASAPIRDGFIGLFIAAFVAVAADIAMKAVTFATFVAEACNPLKAVFGGGSAPDVTSAFGDMMQAIANLVGIARLLGDVIPTLTLGHEIASAFDRNSAQLAVVKKLVDGLKEGTKDMTSESNTFLEFYNNYTPQIEKSKIADYSESLSSFADQLCERAFAGSTSGAAVIEIGISSSGVCNLLAPQILKLGVIYEEIYDYQFDLIDSLAAAVRAYLASSKATSMTSVYESEARVNVEYTSRLALNSLIVSTLHIWTIVTAYCNQLAYLKGGEVPEYCTRAAQVPSAFNVANVLGIRQPACSINNEITDYVDIPTKPTPNANPVQQSRDKSYIDLKELYAGNVVEFEVPSFQWLRDNGWVVGSTETAMYVTRFSWFLTPMDGLFTHIVSLSAEHGGNMKLAENGKLTYILPVKGLESRYSSTYKENTISCSGNENYNPYDLCKRNVTKLCILSDGFDRKDVPPTIYNRWKIKATTLPTGATAPNATTEFKLKAILTICNVDLAAEARGTRDVNQLEDIGLPRQKRDDPVWCCTPPNTYWNAVTASCAACPSGSTPKLNGYYCQ